jgi:hypothetical protein
MHFGHLKILFFKGHESLRSRISCFRCVTLRHFEGLKMRFLKCPPLKVMWLPVGHIGHFDAIPDELWDPELKGTWFLVKTLHNILANWKCDYSSVMWPSTHRYLSSTKALFGLLVAWKWDSSWVMRLLVEEYMAPFEQHFTILRLIWSERKPRLLQVHIVPVIVIVPGKLQQQLTHSTYSRIDTLVR